VAEKTKIAWTDSTFNPWKICTPVGPGCDNCYAAALSRRYGLERMPTMTKIESAGIGLWRKAFNDRAGADPAEWEESLRVQEFPA